MYSHTEILRFSATSPSTPPFRCPSSTSSAAMGIYPVPSLLKDTDIPQSTFQRPVAPTAKAKIVENTPSTKSPNTKPAKQVSLLKYLPPRRPTILLSRH